MVHGFFFFFLLHGACHCSQGQGALRSSSPTPFRVRARSKVTCQQESIPLQKIGYHFFLIKFLSAAPFFFLVEAIGVSRTSTKSSHTQRVHSTGYGNLFPPSHTLVKSHPCPPAPPLPPSPIPRPLAINGSRSCRHGNANMVHVLLARSKRAGSCALRRGLQTRSGVAEAEAFCVYKPRAASYSLEL